MKSRLVPLVSLILLIVFCLSAQAPTPPASKLPTTATVASPAPSDPFLGVRFLVGSWESKTTGGIAQAKASAGYAFRLELRDHILARHSRSGACNAPDDFDCQHSDLLYLYPTPDGSAIQAIYFDNEGHIIHYYVTTPAPNSVVSSLIRRSLDRNTV